MRTSTGEFGRVNKGIWTQITTENERISDVVAVKTLKSMSTSRGSDSLLILQICS